MKDDESRIGSRMMDRRSLLGAAGMGALLAGCDFSRDKECIPPAGYCLDHGDSPSMQKPFTPVEMCVVFIEFGQSPAPRVIHAYIKDLPATDDLSLKDLANRALKQLAGTPSNVTFYETRYNFDRLSFRAPTKVVVFVNNADTAIRFAEETPGSKSNFVIRFTPVAGLSFISGVPHFKNTRVNKNFYGVDRILISGLAGTAAYWLNFLNRKNETATQINDVVHSNHNSWWLYSMNIHLLVKVPKVKPTDPEWMPIVFDPDTGNMGSDP